jgi:hypothetical protein
MSKGGLNEKPKGERPPAPPKGVGSSIKSPKNVNIHIHIHVNSDIKSPHELADIVSEQIMKQVKQQGLL